MTKIVDLPDFLAKRRQYGIWTDFLDVDAPAATAAEGWVLIDPDTGTIAISDGVKGILTLTNGALDNNEVYMGNEVEAFKFLNDKPFVFEALVHFSEANTDDANVIVGLADGLAADLMQDNGAGPKASYSGCVFYKVDGGTQWYCETSIGTTQQTTLTDPATTAGGSSYQCLRIEYKALSSTLGQVTYYIDGVEVCCHTFTITSATEMQIVAGIKNGGANAETLSIDYIGCEQLR